MIPCALIPVYNHERAVGRVVAAVRAAGLACILVDDGSSPECARVLDALAASDPKITLVRLQPNRGKGGAVTAGFEAACAAGFTHALQIDADGQHTLADIPRFIAEAGAHPGSIICGRPVFDASIPGSRRYGRLLTHALVWLWTLSLSIPDAMCGFRVYPLAPVAALLKRARLGARMDFDVDILVRLYWERIPMRWIDTKVTYPLDGVSHYDLLRDNLRMARLHAKLFIEFLPRLPQLLWHKLA